MRFILNLFKTKPASVPAARLKHAGFSAEDRRAFQQWNSNAGMYR